MAVDDTRRRLESDAQADIDRTNKEYIDSVKEFNDVASEEMAKATDTKGLTDVPTDSLTAVKPAETINSKGYDPGTSTPTDSGVRRQAEGVPSTYGSNNDSSYGHHNGLPRQEGVEEQAPDVGKDYGSTPQGDGYNENGYNSYDERAKQSPEEEKEKKGKEEKKGEQDLEKKDKGNPEKKDGDKKTDQKEEGEKKPQHGQEKVDPNQQKKKTDGQQGGQPQQTGNGYGATKKQQASTTDQSDPTARARRNLQHNNQARNGDSPKPTTGTKKNSGSSPKGGGSPLKNALAKAGAGIKNAASKIGKGKTGPSKGKNDKSAGDKVADKAGGTLKNLMFRFIMSHPMSIVVIAIIAVILIVLLFEAMDAGRSSNGRGKRSCTYELNGIVSTGTVELKDIKVEVINCDGKADNYTVLDTVDFEKYILGVALAEAGPSSPDEALKAQMIAVRNFSLTRNKGMCPSNPDNCFHGYNPSTGIIRMRACTNDQVYWDYTKDCPKIERPGQPTLYCEGVSGSTDIWKKALSPERIKEVEALANEVMGEVLLDENGDVLKLGYMAAETDKFIADANAGKSYVEILEAVYGSSSYSSAKCSYGGVYDYGDYELSSDGDEILHQPLGEFLEKNGSSLEEFNELIADNVDDAGWGTRAGVVAAAVTLIAELGNNYDVKVPYYWGGGHYDGVVDGALDYWGSTKCHTYANNQHYNYCGFDCSGFVPWAIKNGGFKKGVDLANNFQNMPNARKVTLSNKPVMQPGDLLESRGHIILIVGIDEASGQYICAEAMGNAYGVLFTRRSFTEDGYWGVDLEDYYNDPNYIREPIR